MPLSPSELLDRAAAGVPAAIGRAISMLADRRPGYLELLALMYRRRFDAEIIGVTGSPGAGKSTLVDAMIQRLRAGDRRVGVVAVDPSSPFSGGALLGDRVRMQRHAADEGVFIRSLASRGVLGGLGPAAAQAARLLGLAGFSPVIIETVGVGQAEVEIMGVADLVLMVLVPGNGDEVQCLKAGVMEIGDVFVLNKADRDGADRLAAEIEMNLRLADPGFVPAKRIVRTIATEPKGIDTLLDLVDEMFADFKASGEAERRRRVKMKRQLRAHLRREIVERFYEYDKRHNVIEQAVDGLLKGEGDPVAFSRSIAARFSAWLGGLR